MNTKALMTMATVLVPLLGHGAVLENHAVCTLRDGRQLSELLQYAGDYETAAANAGVVDYRVRILVPRFAANLEPGQVIWVGVHPMSQFEAVDVFYRSADWAPKLRSLVTCSAISMWQVLD